MVRRWEVCDELENYGIQVPEMASNWIGAEFYYKNQEEGEGYYTFLPDGEGLVFIGLPKGKGEFQNVIGWFPSECPVDLPKYGFKKGTLAEEIAVMLKDMGFKFEPFSFFLKRAKIIH